MRHLDFKAESIFKRLRNTVPFYDTKGIIGDERDLLLRRLKYGENIYPMKKSKAFGQIFAETFGETSNRILMASAILSIILDYTTKGNWLNGVTIIILFIFISFRQALRIYNCQNAIKM